MMTFCLLGVRGVQEKGLEAVAESTFKQNKELFLSLQVDGRAACRWQESVERGFQIYCKAQVNVSHISHQSHGII